MICNFFSSLNYFPLMPKILVTMIFNSTIKINQTSDGGWAFKSTNGFSVVFAKKWQDSDHKKTWTKLGIGTKKRQNKDKSMGGKKESWLMFWSNGCRDKTRRNQGKQEGVNKKETRRRKLLLFSRNGCSSPLSSNSGRKTPLRWTYFKLFDLFCQICRDGIPYVLPMFLWPKIFSKTDFHFSR